MLQRVLILIMLTVLGGCASGFHETHYLRSADQQGRAINYYRLRVDGWTLFASSRYTAGWFDEKAVEAYFSEFSQPEKGRIGPAALADGGEVQPIDPRLRGRILVMILSSNSDAIAAQIGQFAQNNALMSDLTRLVQRDRIREVQDAVATTETQMMRTQALADLGQQMISGLEEDAPPEIVTRRLLSYVNRLAAELGSEQPFASLDEAHDWLRYNRGRLLKD